MAVALVHAGTVHGGTIIKYLGRVIPGQVAQMGGPMTIKHS
jgi:hypothetical protein